MSSYRVLVIAPKTDLLLVDDEVQQVVNLLGARLLQGSQANIHGLLAALVEPFDIIWFATHGDENGVYLSDGVLNTSEITAMVRSVGAGLVMLNTCSSRAVALAIHDELGIQLVCTVRPVPDRMAFITATLFARKLSLNCTYREAYDLSKPGQNGTYLFLPSFEIEPAMEKNQKVDEELTSIINLVRRLEILVIGNQDYNVDGLVPTVRTLGKQIDQLALDFSNMRSSQVINRRLLIGVTFIAIALLVAMTILVFQRGVL